MASSEKLRINKNQHKPKEKPTNKKEIDKLKLQMQKIKLADYQTPTKKPIDKYNNAVKKITIRDSRLC